MTRTVGELRNDIRAAIGRFERRDSPAFTKEDLAALCAAVDYDIDTSGRLPPKAQMRAGIRRSIGEVDTDDPTKLEGSFRKAELVAIISTLQPEELEP